MIRKGGMALKPLLPQLQTSFIKCLGDNTRYHPRIVRSSAALALGKLSALSTRVDPLVSDLLSSLQASDGGVRESTLTALKGVVKYAGKSVSSAIKTRVYSLLKELIYDDDEQIRGSASRIFGIFSQLVTRTFFLPFNTVKEGVPSISIAWLKWIAEIEAFSSIWPRTTQEEESDCNGQCGDIQRSEPRQRETQMRSQCDNVEEYMARTEKFPHIELSSDDDDDNDENSNGENLFSRSRLEFVLRCMPSVSLLLSSNTVTSHHSHSQAGPKQEACAVNLDKEESDCNNQCADIRGSEPREFESQMKSENDNMEQKIAKSEKPSLIELSRSDDDDANGSSISFWKKDSKDFNFRRWHCLGPNEEERVGLSRCGF